MTASQLAPAELTDQEIDRLALALVEEEYGNEHSPPYTAEDITTMADVRRIAETLARRALAFTAAVDGIGAPDSGLRLVRACRGSAGGPSAPRSSRSTAAGPPACW